MRRLGFSLLCMLFVCNFIISQTFALSYVVTDLGTLGGSKSDAFGINESGQIVGHSSITDYKWHGFLWDSTNGMQDIGSFGGAYTHAYDINESAYVVGSSDIADTNPTSWHAFLWDSTNGMQDLGTLGGPQSTARSINNLGQIVGSSSTLSDDSHAFLWESGTMNDLNEQLPANSSWDFLAGAEDITDTGKIVGYGVINSERRGYLLENNSIVEIGTLPGDIRSDARLINNLGQVVGVSYNSDLDPHGFIWENGVMTDINTLGAWRVVPSGFNNPGQIVGFYISSPTEYFWRPFIWDATNGIQDLNNLLASGTEGVVLQQARDVNDAGQIVGYGQFNGLNHAFLLTPSDLPPIGPPLPNEPIPEPMTILLMGCGLVGLLGVVIRQRRKMK